MAWVMAAKVTPIASASSTPGVGPSWQDFGVKRVGLLQALSAAEMRKIQVSMGRGLDLLLYL